ncbi:MAG: endonuclease/exonuclease/phosphatase family protein [Deltaproteobacteria bacterium]
MDRKILIFFLLGIVNYINSQIIIDENYSDWTSVTTITDPAGDAFSNLDFTSMQINNDSEYLYFRFAINQDVNLQDESKILLQIDIDNNSLTGKQVNGIGADVIYDFGQRTGYYHRNSQIYNFNHSDCGLLSLPTVTSAEFEFAIKRKFNAGNYLILIGNKIRTYMSVDIANGDKIPDQSGGYSYSMNTNAYSYPGFTIDKTDPGHLRIMSYNVKQDGIFEDEPPYKRKIRAIRPDILCFQEIYNHSSGEMKSKVQSYFGGNWYDAKIGSDIIVISKYPVSRFESIGGNGAFLINYNGVDILIINVHFYCCDNDIDRQVEVDEIIQFIRNSRNGFGPFNIKKNTPIIITGDTNFVGSKRQRITLTQGDIVNESKYGKDFLPDWDNSFLEDVKPFTTGYSAAFTWYSPWSSYPAGRLDYIFYTGSVLQLENAFVLCTDNLSRDILDNYQLNNEDSANASDHLPVVADFSLRSVIPVNEISGVQTKLIVYPSPATDVLNIQWLLTGIENQIFIIDIDGKSVWNKKFRTENDVNNTEINICDWKPGYYRVLIYDKERILFGSEGFMKL